MIVTTPTYRKGVKVGNYVEDLAASDNHLSGSILGTNGHFDGPPITTAQSTYTAHHPAAPVREDLKLKYIKYGRFVPTGTDTGPSCFATTSQLAYGSTVPTTVADQPYATEASVTVKGDTNGSYKMPFKVQDILWTNCNAFNAKVPRAVLCREKAEQREQRLMEESKDDMYVTSEKKSLEAVAKSEHRAAARQVQCRPKAEGGQEAQVGRKATGEFKRALEKDFWRIGLRK